MDSHKLSERIQSVIDGLSKFGSDLRVFADPNTANEDKHTALQNAVDQSHVHNAWFTPNNTLTALSAWGNLLQPQPLQNWLSHYTIDRDYDSTVGIVMAGNLPLVGFHDLLCVLVSGHKAAVKLSSKDAFLIPVLVDMLTKHLPTWKGKVSFCKEQLKGHDKVIATGSNNSSRYFEYYFRNKPHVVRKNRSSVAILTGRETEDEMKGLAQDITRYFGLGCRSVSKILVPKDYNFDMLFNALYAEKDIIHHHAYANNYDYNRAIYLMGEENMLDNGFMLVKQDTRLASPVGCLYFDYYDTMEHAKKYLKEMASEIQCVVGHLPEMETVPFGNAQFPNLDDYADGVDTMAFLLKN
ncbi:MAG: acyl-CoA reductase [Flavobacteriaceae bacterium]